MAGVSGSAMAKLVSMQQGLLREHGFSGRGRAWTAQLESGLLYCVGLEPAKVQPDESQVFSLHWGVSVRGWLHEMFGKVEPRTISAVFCALHGRPSHIVGRSSNTIDWFCIPNEEDLELANSVRSHLEHITNEVVLPFLESFRNPEDLLKYLQHDSKVRDNVYFGPYSEESRWRTVSALARVLGNDELAQRASAKASALRR